MQMLENEKLLAALDSSKKHLDNKEFVEVVQQQKQVRCAAHGAQHNSPAELRSEAASTWRGM